MEKNINDYAHLYLGCECEIDCWKDAEDDMPGSEKTRKVIELDAQVLEDLEWFKPTPILRPLSDMKNTEINAIATLILGKETTCGKIDWTDDKTFCCAYWKKEESLDIRYDFIEMGMHISNIGNNFRIDHVWNYIKGNGTGCSHEPLHNSHEITLYLLRQSFDIFGLIESGLAIDKTKQLAK